MRANVVNRSEPQLSIFSEQIIDQERFTAEFFQMDS
jgi:hypothetical protein